MTAIVDIIGREILDSRGNPTVEVDVVLEDGSPGAPRSVGRLDGAHEAVELRDGDKERYLGKGVPKAVDAVNGEIFDASAAWMPSPGRDRRPDRARRHAQQGRLGATPSRRLAGGWPRRPQRPMACRSIDTSGTSARLLPVPMMNIVNGGVHADNPIDFQEFMVMPVGAESFAEGLRMGVEVFRTLKGGAEGRRAQHQCGGRRRFAPNLASADAALGFVMKAIETAGYPPGEDIVLALDRAATEFFKGGAYVYEGEGKNRSMDEQATYLAELVGTLSDRVD